jgi:hypothetical protein
MVFENASGEIELWNKSASNQIDSQLRDRRRGFKRRRDSLERIQTAAGDLDARIADLEGQEQRLQQLWASVRQQAAALRDAAAVQAGEPAAAPTLPASPVPPAIRAAG